MKINDVEKLTEMTKKTIRFYEEQDLIHPARQENGYREYTQEDVEALLRIKFLRNLSVPIGDIRKVKQGKMTLPECMENNSSKIKEQRKTLDVIAEIGEEISSGNMSWENIDLNSFDARMKEVQKGGIRLGRMEEYNRKKMRGARIGAGIFAAIMILAWVIVLVANHFEPLPTGLFIVVSIVLLAPVAGCIWAIKARADELKKGEEYEAIKY